MLKTHVKNFDKCLIEVIITPAGRELILPTSETIFKLMEVYETECEFCKNKNVPALYRVFTY